MFKIKRPAIIGILLVLLVFTGYLNYELTQEALKKTSNQYKKHELVEKSKNEKNKGISDNAKEDVDGKKFEIVDLDQDNIKEVVNNTKEVIDESMDKEVSSSTRNYFIEYKLSRDKLRASLVDRLDNIVANDKTDSKTRSDAQQEIVNLGKISEKELQIEGLIKAKGFEEVLVILTEEDAKAIISINELTEQDMIKILDIVKEETKFDINNIKIIKKQ